MPLSAFTCFSGTYALERHPPSAPTQPLRAWDAADEYLLSAAAPLLTDQPQSRVLIVNDTFGALAVALHAGDPHSWGDSFTARCALGENLRRNALPETVTFVPATAVPPGKPSRDGSPTPPGYDMVLWRVPKSRALFEQQRAVLSPLLHPDTFVVAGGMTKHLPDQTKEALSVLGPVNVYPVVKKATLLRLQPSPDREPLTLPPETTIFIEEYGLEMVGGPNVFAREKFDIGARFFTEQFASLPASERIADLGCGSGILGLVAKQRHPGAELSFFDESYQAIAAAEENYRRNGFVSVGPAARFSVDDCLTHYRGEPFDLILCNPPFHQGHVIGDETAWRMFTQSRNHLRAGGELWIVGNRHLEYHLKLRRLFGNCRQIAAHPKFVVLAATKR